MLGKLVRNNKGQLLIEAMVAMGVIAIGLLGAFSLLSSSLGISKITSNQYVGTYLAAEGIEVVKNMIDTNVSSGDVGWNNNLVGQGGGPYSFTVQYNSSAPESCPPGNCPAPGPTTYLLFDPSTGTYNYTAGNPTVFTRTVTVQATSTPGMTSSNDELQVDSVVTWTDEGGIPDSVKLEDLFYYWDQTQTDGG